MNSGICTESKHGATIVDGPVHLRVTLNKRFSQHCNILRTALQRNTKQQQRQRTVKHTNAQCSSIYYML